MKISVLVKTSEPINLVNGSTILGAFSDTPEGKRRLGIAVAGELKARPHDQPLILLLELDPDVE